jgi:hypothetical protein
MSANPRGSGGGGPRRTNPNSPPPDQEPPVDRNYLRQRFQTLAWVRYGLGLVAGLIAGLIQFSPPGVFNSNSYADIYLAVFIYIGSYYLAKYGMKIPLPYKDRNKLITQGIGGFIMMFLFLWVIYTTYCFSSGNCFAFRFY